MLLQFSRFVLVGIAATALHYAILFVLADWLRVPPVAASSIGFVVSALANYALNRAYTFRSDVAHAVGLARFAAVSASGLALNAVVMAVLTAVTSLHYLVAQVGATLVVLGFNYLAHRHWTYAGAPR